MGGKGLVRSYSSSRLEWFLLASSSYCHAPALQQVNTFFPCFELTGPKTRWVEPFIFQLISESSQHDRQRTTSSVRWRRVERIFFFSGVCGSVASRWYVFQNVDGFPSPLHSESGRLDSPIRRKRRQPFFRKHISGIPLTHSRRSSFSLSSSCGASLRPVRCSSSKRTKAEGKASFGSIRERLRSSNDLRTRKSGQDIVSRSNS